MLYGTWCHTIIKAFKEELACATDKQFLNIGNNVIENSYTTKELNNKAIFNLKLYSMCCYVALSNVCN